MAKFSLGQTVMTRGVAHLVQENPIMMHEINSILNRHVNGDWGELCDDDKEANDYAIDHKDRILSSYFLGGEHKVWVITEWDRSVTTVLFPDEY